MDTQTVEHNVEDTLAILDDRRDNFFHAGHWGQCLELLSHLCQYGDSIILVCGPSGIGKTCMQQALQHNEADKFSFCALNATPYLTGESLQECIDPVIEQYNQLHKDVVLVMDDAQELSMDILALLLQLKQKTIGGNRLRIILFANYDLEKNVLRSVLKDEFIEHVHIIEIEPLTLTEVEAFLMQQWRLTNSREEFPFDKSKLKKIFAASGGIPGEVQRIVKEMLGNKKAGAKKDLTDGLSPVMVGLTVSFGILFCLLAFLWPSADDSLINKKNSVENLSVATMPSSDEDEPLESGGQVVINPEVNVETVATVEASEPNEPMAAVIDSNMSEQTAELLELEPLPQTSTTVAIAPTPQPTTVHKDLNDDEKIQRLEKKLVLLQQQLAGEQEARKTAEAKYKDAMTNPKGAKSNQILPKPSQSKITKPTTNKPITKTGYQSKTKTIFTKNEQNILSMPSKNYTIQMLGLRDEIKVKEFIKKHKLSDSAHYYKTMHRGKPWYVLVYGNYNSKLAAQNAVTKMPLALRKLQPWPRAYTHVQKTIRQNHE